MISTSIADEFRSIVGNEWFLDTPEDLATYSYDGFLPEFEPDAVIVPGNRDDISKIMRVANRELVNIIPRGAGTNICGSSVARRGGIIIAFHRMNKILEIDPENMCAVVQPGVVNADLKKEVAQYNLMYPPDPASLFVSTIGGNVALNAGGPRGVKYGVTRDYLLGLEVVLPSGEVIKTGGKVLKSVSGYDLTRLMCGSEGTLAVVTKIILRLLPLPKEQIDLLVPYDDFQAAADTVSAIIAEHIVPTTIEFMERDSILAVEQLLEKEVPHHDAAAHLLIQLDGNRREQVDADMEVVGELCLQHGARDVLVARDRPTRERLWEARRKIIEALKHASPINHMEDVVVPRSALPALLKGVRSVAEQQQVRIISFGHAGDGNVHINVLKDALPDERWNELVPAVTDAIYRMSLSLGGQLTGEHGIGATRRKYLPLALDPAQIELMRQIRSIFDPNGILNPAKIFP